MDLKQQFQQAYPTAFFMENKVEAVANYLHSQGWLAKNEVLLSLEKPGEGNMNFVLRAITNQRSFILKQARPWVEKFPQIAAPVERVAVEAQFFKSLEKVEAIKLFAPSCLGFDTDNFILATEDLGKGADYSFLYQQDNLLTEMDIDGLTQYLSALHQVTVPANFPDNLAMRQLNHEHIYNFPYLEENGFNLDDVQTGLQAAAIPYKTNVVLKAKIKACGDIYLAQGKHLLHGDFYPGSWLKVADGLKVIDPEFGFVGPAEFDLGVLFAHLLMAGQPSRVLQSISKKYQQPKDFNEGLLSQFVGIEILRRLIGIAQLPLNLNLETKKKLMQQAAKWIMNEKMSG